MSSSDVAGTVVAAFFTGIPLLGLLAYLVWGFRHAIDLSPQVTVRRISSPGLRHRVRVNRFDIGGAWDPSGNWNTNTWSIGNSMPVVNGPGIAVYWLDDDRQVHLDWSPDDGKPRTLVGPVPAILEPTSPERQRKAHVLRVGLLWYALMTVAGLEVGYRFATGPHRPLIAVFSGLAGYGLAYLIVMSAVVVTHARKHHD